jgi:hypothetical protein
VVLIFATVPLPLSLLLSLPNIHLFELYNVHFSSTCWCSYRLKNLRAFMITYLLLISKKIPRRKKSNHCSLNFTKKKNSSRKNYFLHYMKKKKVSVPRILLKLQIGDYTSFLSILAYVRKYF